MRYAISTALAVLYLAEDDGVFILVFKPEEALSHTYFSRVVFFLL